MVTALDTNVLSALLSGTAEEALTAQTKLREALEQSSLLISPVVYAELRAAPKGSEDEVQALLHDLRIDVDWHLSETSWRLAADAYRAYALRRRQQGADQGSKRLLADFIIGAHALEAAGRLLTFDQGKYRAVFPSLELP